MARLGTRLSACVSAVVLVATAAMIPSGSAAASTADTSPPVVDSLTGPPVVVGPSTPYADVPLTHTWSAHDPEGSTPLTYDLRYGLPDNDGVLSWQLALDHSRVTTWSATARWYDAHFCVEVRARDAVGNVGAWSAPLCTVIDRGPPFNVRVVPDMTMFRGSADAVNDGLAQTPVTYTFRGEDDDEVASYDVDVRVAPPGASYGPWTSPPAWQGISDTSVAMPALPGGAICFRVRARDRAGYVSDYDNAWCRAIPYDDRDFRIHGGATRVRRGAALGGTVTRSWGRRGHGSMTLRGVTGQHVWVRFVGPRDAEACAWVTLGGRRDRDGCWGERGPGAVWQGFDFPPGTRGRLRIRSALSIDAVAVVR